VHKNTRRDVAILPRGFLQIIEWLTVVNFSHHRIIVKFEGFSGKYVWHCHMLEHEDNETMRPYIITTA
jgi:FtsP/CotA-like multicopper oxidase with cupredoxin domain